MFMMKDKNKEKVNLSIGIPAFNQGEYLRSTIESVLSQTIAPAEIVVSDNWSNDETIEIARSFGDRITLIRPPHHLPMMAHWNYLVSNLRGNWFSLLSSDDEAKPNFVATFINGIERSVNAVLIRSGYENIDGEGKVIDKRYILSVKAKTTPPLTFYEQLYGPRVNFSAFAVKKESWDIVGGFPESLNLSGDWGLWLSIAPLGDFIYQHEIVSRYRTQYRPTISAERQLASIHDDVSIYGKIIPAVLQGFKDPDFVKVARASKARCLKNLGSASRITDRQGRASALDTLRPWAIETGQSDIWSRIQGGERLPEPKSRSSLYSVVRRLYQYSRSI